MKIVAFADIHYAQYSTGVTVDDCMRVERQITTFAKGNGASAVVFAGDRFLSHEPADWIRLIADGEQRYRNDLGLVTFSLIGNHDLWAKAPISGHSNRQAQQLYGDVHPFLVVMDRVATYRHASVPGLAVHAVPAGVDWTAELFAQSFDFQSGEHNVLVFHALAENSILDYQTSYRSAKGQPLSLLDDSRWDLVLGGDVHVPQMFDLKHTRGGYIGAAIQQSRRDRGSDRGWIQAELSLGSVKTSFYAGSAPRFLDIELDLQVNGLPTAAEVEAMLLDRYADTPEGNIIDVILHGTRAQLDAVPRDWTEKLSAQLRARRVNPPMKRAVSTIATMALAPVGQKGGHPVQDLESYLFSGRAVLDGHDPQRLLTVASGVLQGLRKCCD